jgi:hypothetical protein
MAAALARRLPIFYGWVIVLHRLPRRLHDGRHHVLGPAGIRRADD